MSRPLRIALLQLPAFDLANHEAAWAELLTRIDEAGAHGPDLIITPEASYPAYFLYSRETYEAAGVYDDASIEAAIAERAQRFGATIAAGLVQRRADRGLSNASVLFAPDGQVLGRYGKSFLWHFDQRWFTPGDEYPVYDLPSQQAGAYRMGTYICADARLSEIPRTLAVGGARLLAVSTAWVSSGRHGDALATPQVDYLTPARAIENGAWIAAADKVGVEANSIVYAGRSGVVAPDGRWVVQAPPDRPGIAICTIDLDEAQGPPIERRPALYADAALVGASSEAAALARAPVVMEGSGRRVAAIAFDPTPSAVDLMEAVRQLVRALAVQQVALAVLPDLTGQHPRAVAQDELVPLLTALAAETGVTLAVGLGEREGAHLYKTVHLIGTSGEIASHRQTHLSARERAAGFTAGDEPTAVLAIPGMRIALLAGVEGLVPEIARGAKLRGAEVLLWPAGDIGAPLRTLARARANEQRAYVVAAGTTAEQGGGYVIDPTGGVVMETLAGRAMAASGDIHRALSRWHEMSPGTNPVSGRRPETFTGLFAE